MIRLVLVILLFAWVAGATPIAEPDPEQVTIPKAMLLKLIQEYKEQKAANILLWDRQEEVNKRLEAFNNGTGCT